MKRNDAAVMDRILAPDFVLVTGRGRTYSKTDLLEEARKQSFGAGWLAKNWRYAGTLCFRCSRIGMVKGLCSARKATWMREGSLTPAAHSQAIALRIRASCLCDYSLPDQDLFGSGSAGLGGQHHSGPGWDGPLAGENRCAESSGR